MLNTRNLIFKKIGFAFILIILDFLTEISSLQTQTEMKTKITNALKTLSTSSNKRSSNDNEHTLTISGSAIQEIEPNLIIIGITIETLDKDLKKSFTDNSIISNKISEIFKQIGIQKENITTTNYDITPIYENEYFSANNSYVSVFKGYRVKNDIEVSLGNKKLGSDLIDKVILAGPVLINYVTFGFSEGLIKHIKDSLIEKASLDACQRANSITGILKISIKDIKSINLLNFFFPQQRSLNYQYGKAYISEIGSNLAPPKFYSGTQWVTTTVDVTFVIIKK